MTATMARHPATASDTSPAAEVAQGAVTIENLVKAYGAVKAVKGVSFSVPKGQTVTLLGPSGCGKTTTLRCIAGLETPTGGLVTINGKPVYDSSRGIELPPEGRGIGMVFQSYAIWPHLTVGGNVGFPLAIKRTPKNETRQRVAEILEMVGLGDLQDRPASALSGGQQQRVALARAIVHRPNVVLFDEPLSNLDANLRERMRTELQLLQSKLGYTSIFVTHDQQEALALSDHVVVMNVGVIEQQGSPWDVFQSPRTPFTARFLGCANNFEAEVSRSEDGGLVSVNLAGQGLLKGVWRSPEPPRPGSACRAAFRADRVELAAGEAAGNDGWIAGTIETASFLGSRIDYTVQTPGGSVKVEAPVSGMLAVGDPCALRISPSECHIFTDEGSP